MTGLNGAPRPHLYTAETRLGDAISIARAAYPHQASKFVAHVARFGCVTEETAHTYWMLWRHEYLARPLGDRLAESLG
jgi:hypothetical protein